MRFESREKRAFWSIALLGIIPDVVIGAGVAIATEGGFLAVLGTMIALQIAYLALWLKNSVWAWIVYWAGGRRALTKSFITFLSENQFPEPAHYERSVENYLGSVAESDQVQMATRLKAAAQIGAMSMRPLIGGMQYSMRLAMAYEDALEQYKRMFGQPRRPFGD